jgi:hypothetical protein
MGTALSMDDDHEDDRETIGLEREDGCTTQRQKCTAEQVRNISCGLPISVPSHPTGPITAVAPLASTFGGRDSACVG